MNTRQTFERLETTIPGVCVLKPAVFGDARGFFLESYHRSKFADLGIRHNFVQDNHSRSIKNVLRGLHYQLHRPQAKLCRVIEGEVLDVAVDLRVGSPTFGKWASQLLSQENKLVMFIPEGFAHGFLALSDSVQFLYKCSDFHDATDERGILWSDPTLAISWGVSQPIVSDKDSRLPTLALAPQDALPRFMQG